jgi:hypothetical protein
MTYAEWHMLISLANDLHQLLKSEADQSDAAEALASEIIASFRKHWPEVHIERL